MVDKALIKTLVETWGPPGHEHRMRDVIQNFVKDLADEIRADASGNLMCKVSGEAGGKKVMIAAHMDEIGLIISHIDHQGFGRFTSIGTLLPATLYGNRALFENGVIGTIGMENGLDLTKTPRLAEMFIDFSASSADGNTPPVSIGDAAGLWREFTERGDRLIAKSMDDRVGCAVAIEAMRRIRAMNLRPANDLYFTFTTQEEVGLRGAATAAFGVAPDYAIALDVTATGDTPKGTPMAVKLGQGAAIKVVDTRHIVPPALKNLVIRRAQEANIRHQLEILPIGSTDAAAIQITAAGVPSAAISIPCRYVHTTSETVDINDVAACIDLLVEVATKPIDI